jgi:hypothetical protein
MAGQGQLLRLRGKSPILKGRVGYLYPEVPVLYHSAAAPGAVGTRLWRAPAPCKLLLVRITYTTQGAGSSKIFLRKHLAAHVAAPNAAVSGSNIVDLITDGAPADGTVNVVLPAEDTALVDTDGVLFATGDKLMMVTPATLAGLLVELYFTFTGKPVGA